MLFTHGWGTRTAANASARGSAPEVLEVDGDTIFRIGSISKLFTDLMLYRLAEEGAVDPYAPITDLAPDYAPAWPAGTTPTPRAATLRDLGSHMAGLARYAPCNFGACNITLKTALERLKDWTLLSEPGAAAPLQTNFPTVAAAKTLLDLKHLSANACWLKGEESAADNEHSVQQWPGSQVAYSNTGFALLGRLLELVGSPTKPKGQVALDCYLLDSHCRQSFP